MANDVSRWNEITDAEQFERLAKLLRKLPLSLSSEKARSKAEPVLTALERAAQKAEHLAKELRQHGRKTTG